MAKKRSKKISDSKSSVKKNCPQCGYDPCHCASIMSCGSTLHPIHLGLALGLTWGIAIFAMSAMGINTGANTFIGLIFNQYVSVPTAMAGGLYALIYGFIDGFFGGIIIGSLYNKLNRNCMIC